MSGKDPLSRVVVVAPNWLGDCVMALPVLRAIRRARPEGGLAVLARRGVAALFRSEGSADAVLERSGLFGDARRLRAGRFAEAWLLPNSFRSAIAPWLAGIPERIGYDTDRRGRLLTHALPPPRPTEHQLRDYDALLQSRGIAPDLEAPRLSVAAKALDHAVSALEAAGLDRDEPLALLAPGAAFGWTKRWPAERYGALGDLLAARGFASAVVIGPGEQRLGAAVAASARALLPVLGADLDALELSALLSCARVVVANDSGPMHLAAAVGVPVAAFFGPTDPGRTAPSGVPAIVLDRYVFCSPCFLKECPYGHECMREITPEDALRAVEELLTSSLSS
jgi:heptosyltransferase-2